jgi:peroxiredoxin
VQCEHRTRTAGLPVDTPAPGFALANLAGATISLTALRALGKPVVLVFSDPACGPCTALLPQIGRWQRDDATKVVVALISQGTVEANRTKVVEYGLTHVLLQQDREIAEAYQAAGTPSAVLVRRDGTIGSPLAQGAEAIGALLTSTVTLPEPGVLPPVAATTGQRARPPVAQVGEPAPGFTLPDLRGNQVHLSDFRGSKTLVLFWNPECGFCQRMLSDLKAWEARKPAGAPQLLVVSTGTVEANQAMRLRSPVVLDQGLSVGNSFGATGTPMAVLVDAEGKIASEGAAGAPAVLALASQRQDNAISA